jgi:hypothetical protein
VRALADPCVAMGVHRIPARICFICYMAVFYHMCTLEIKLFLLCGTSSTTWHPVTCALPPPLCACVGVCVYGDECVAVFRRKKTTLRTLTEIAASHLLRTH